MRLILAAFLLLLAVPAQAGGLIEEDIRLPARFAGLFGPRTLSLSALVVRPDDGGRHPLAILSHGAPRNEYDRHTRSPRDQLDKARELARRGWVTVAVMRRGYGESEGEYAEDYGRCSAPAYEPAGRAAAEDLRETARLMAEKSYVDAGTVIAVGHSAGGFASVALAADPPPGLKAAVIFAGGRGSPRPDEVCGPEVLADTYARFGQTARVPMLWVYAENDHYIGPALARRLYAAFTGAGGRADLVMLPPFGEDGHKLFSTKGAHLWTAQLDAFLVREGLAQAAPAVAAPPRASALPPEQAVTIPVRGEVTESFYLTLPAAPPKAILILFPGGGGAIDVREPVPSPERAGNFLARSRALLAERGFVVATLDAPSDSADGMPEHFRVSATHAEDVGKVAAWLKARYKLPVWLVGTSRGTLSAANGTLRLGAEIDGLVLTSTVTRASRQGPFSVLAMELDKITQPTLVMSQAADGCSRSPAVDGPKLTEKIGASRKAFVELTGGGEPQSPPCEGRSHHGFIGQEDEAVGVVVGFVAGE